MKTCILAAAVLSLAGLAAQPASAGPGTMYEVAGYKFSENTCTYWRADIAGVQGQLTSSDIIEAAARLPPGPLILYWGHKHVDGDGAVKWSGSEKVAHLPDDLNIEGVELALAHATSDPLIYTSHGGGCAASFGIKECVGLALSLRDDPARSYIPLRCEDVPPPPSVPVVCTLSTSHIILDITTNGESEGHGVAGFRVSCNASTIVTMTSSWAGGYRTGHLVTFDGGDRMAVEICPRRTGVCIDGTGLAVLPIVDDEPVDLSITYLAGPTSGPVSRSGVLTVTYN